MILSFKSRFIRQIKFSNKINTIRKSGRWKVGMMIHFYEGNPRNGGKAFGTGEVKHIHPIIIDPLENSIHVHNTITEEIKFIKNPDYLNAFARVDGFQDWEEMKTFFPKRFEGDFIDWGYSFKPIES